jgi:hypothetical protein
MTRGIRPLSLSQRLATFFLYSLIVAFNFWTAMTSDTTALPGKDLGHYYDLLAKAFLSGHLHLLVEPRAELLALKDPYDTQQNAEYRLHDAALYRGRYYLYYGPSSALVLFAPFRKVTGYDFPEPLAVAIFCSIGLLFSYLLLELLCRTYLPELPFWLLLVGIPVLGFGNSAPFLLRRPVHYEVAISGGYAFAFASLYCYMSAFLRRRQRRTTLLCASLLLGLAAGSRFSLLAATLVPLCLGLHYFLKHRCEGVRENLIMVLAMFGPLAICIFLLGLYNYIRFESPAEFGLHYLLHGLPSARTYKFYSFSRLPSGLLYYILAPPHFSADFPFVSLAPSLVKRPAPDFYLEPVAGILVLAPVTLMLLFLPFSYRLVFGFEATIKVTACALSAAGIGLLIICAMVAGTMRYIVDFATFLLIPALLLWYAWIVRTREGQWLHAAVVQIFLVLAGATVVLNGAISLTGYYDNLKRGSPEVYNRIHHVFRPLELTLGSKKETKMAPCGGSDQAVFDRGDNSLHPTCNGAHERPSAARK